MSSDGSRLTKLEGLVRSLGARLASSVGAVSSVFGRTGAVVAAVNDYTWAQINKTTSSLADITTKSHTSLSDIGTNSHATIDTHIAATAAHGATGEVVGTTNTQTLTNKSMSEAQITFTDITTGNASTANHGFLKKLDNTATNFMNGQGNWSAPAGGNWDRLATANLGADAASLSSGTFTAKKNLLVVGYIVGLSANGNVAIRFNSDSGANYSTRRNLNGTTAAATSSTEAPIHDTTTSDRKITFSFIVTNNIAGNRKCFSGTHVGNTEAAATAPDSSQFSGVWHNTASQITSVQFIATNIRANSEIHVYGSD